MKSGVILGTSILAALIAGGEIEQGYFNAVGIICVAWLALVVVANLRKIKAPRVSSEQSANYCRVIKHSLMISQTDLHVKKEASK